jgi:hypothetical protein
LDVFERKQPSHVELLRFKMASTCYARLSGLLEQGAQICKKLERSKRLDLRTPPHGVLGMKPAQRKVSLRLR